MAPQQRKRAGGAAGAAGSASGATPAAAARTSSTGAGARLAEELVGAAEEEVEQLEKLAG